jgi:hypothetical protein
MILGKGLRRWLPALLALVVAGVLISGCGGSADNTSTPAPTEPSAPAGAAAGEVAKCHYEAASPAPTNDVQVSGGATCAQAKWLYFHRLRPSDTVRGWTCAQQSLGPHGPTLAFCTHGRNKRASFLYH